MSKLLILSNNALCASSANGRTMMNMVRGFSSNELAQFYLSGMPDADVCKNYYNVSDNDALYAFKHLGKTKKPHIISGASDVNGSKSFEENERIKAELKKQNLIGDNNTKKTVRNCKNLILRDIVWRSMLWWSKDFDRFIDDFSPDAVMLQAGDSPFMFVIARKIAKKKKIPLLMFNTEGYVLKELLYAGSSKKDIWHNIFQKMLRKQYAKFMKNVYHCFYLTEFLEESYQKKYPHPSKSTAVYNVSTLDCLEDKSGTPFRLTYCGNLGMGRYIPLYEIANVLKNVDSTATLDIYGKFPDKQQEEYVTRMDNVRYFGFVSYDKVPDILAHSNMLLHCANNKRLKNMIYGFTTKIGDCLASGRPFLVYATSKYPFVQYLMKNGVGHIAEDKEQLEEILKKSINDKAFADKYKENNLMLAKKNHSVEAVSSKVKKIIDDICNKTQ